MPQDKQAAETRVLIIGLLLLALFAALLIAAAIGIGEYIETPKR